MFVHSLELGHTAGTRAIKSMGECYIHAHSHTHTFPSNGTTTNKTFHFKRSEMHHQLLWGADRI